MSRHHGNDDISRQWQNSATPNKAKPTRGTRLYRKPTFRLERVFETQSLSCGTIISTQLRCGTIQETS
jgi:hypothetical protein